MAEGFRCPACGGSSFPVSEFGTGRLVARICTECGGQIDLEHADWCSVKAEGYCPDTKENDDE